MSLVAERQEPEAVTEPRRPIPQAAPAGASNAAAHQALLQELANRRAWKASVLGAVNVLVAVLAVRLILMVSVLGGIALAWSGVTSPDPLRLAAVGIYGVLVLLPIVWLASRR